jgi:hypothetical protein
MKTSDLTQSNDAYCISEVRHCICCYTSRSFEDFMMMKNGVFSDVTSCGSCKNRRFGGTLRLLHQGGKNRD